MLTSLPSVQLEPLYDSEFATVDPVLPAAATAAVCEPKPPVPLLAVFNEPPLAQAELGIPAAFPKPLTLCLQIKIHRLHLSEVLKEKTTPQLVFV